MKICRNCLQEKEYIFFHKDKYTKDGYAVYCKECKSIMYKQYIAANPHQAENRKTRSKKWKKNNIDRYNKSIKEWKENNADRKWLIDKKSHLWTHYRMTIKQYTEMLVNQDGKCLICQEKRRLVVDHDHGCCSGKLTCGNCVRGLLCHRCNTLIGILEKNKSLIHRTIQYLSETNTNIV